MPFFTSLFLLHPASHFLLVTAFLVTTIVQMLNPYIIIGLNQALSIPPETTSLIVFFALTSGSLLAVLFSFIVSKFWIFRTAIISMMLLSVGLFLLFVITQLSLATFTIILFIALTMIRASVNIFTMSSRTLQILVNPSLPATLIMSFVATSFSIGTIVAPILGETLFDLGGLSFIVTFSLVFSLVSIGGLFYLFPLRKTMVVAEVADKIYFHRPEPHIFIVSVIAMLGYILHAVVYSIVPLAASSSNEGYSSVKIFFISMAIMRLIVPVAMASIRLHEKLKPTVAFGIAICMLWVANMAIFQINWIDSTIFLILIGATFGVGEAILSIFTMAALNHDPVRPDKLPIHNGIYIFLTSAIGIGLGQYLGTAAITFLRLNETILLSTTAASLGFISIFFYTYVKKGD